MAPLLMLAITLTHADTSDWLTEYAPPTSRCPHVELAEFCTKMQVAELRDVPKLPSATSVEFHGQLSDDETPYQFWYAANSGTPQYSGFPGLLVARDGCIVSSTVKRINN